MMMMMVMMMMMTEVTTTMMVEPLIGNLWRRMQMDGSMDGSERWVAV